MQSAQILYPSLASKTSKQPKPSGTHASPQHTHQHTEEATHHHHHHYHSSSKNSQPHLNSSPPAAAGPRPQLLHAWCGHAQCCFSKAAAPPLPPDQKLYTLSQRDQKQPGACHERDSHPAVPPNNRKNHRNTPEQQSSCRCWSASTARACVVWAGPVLLGLQVRRVLTQTVGVVCGRTHVTAHQLTTIPAHLRVQHQHHLGGQGGIRRAQRPCHTLSGALECTGMCMCDAAGSTTQA
jgi:hypothetical protein